MRSWARRERTTRSDASVLAHAEPASRTFVERTRHALGDLKARQLGDLRLAVMMLDGRAPAPLCRRPASATSSTVIRGDVPALDRRRDARSRGAVPQGSSVTPSYPASPSRSNADSGRTGPTRTRPRRPRSQSLSNDHTWTVVTEVPRRDVGACPGGPSHSPAAATHGVGRVSHDLVASGTHTEVRSFCRKD